MINRRPGAAPARPLRAASRAGFTLVEVLVTVASLIIVLGLMANLARSVRRQASEQQTKSLLMTLGSLLDKYVARNGQLPRVAPFPPAAPDPAVAGTRRPPPPPPPRDDPRPPPPAPAATSPATDPLADEPELREAARANNRDIVA